MIVTTADADGPGGVVLQPSTAIVATEEMQRAIRDAAANLKTLVTVAAVAGGALVLWSLLSSARRY